MDSVSHSSSGARDKGILFLLNALLMAYLAYGWKFLQPTPMPAPLPTRPMPEKPVFFDWQNIDLFAPVQVDSGAADPFQVEFDLPAIEPKAPEKPTPPPAKPQPPPPPPPRIVTVRYNGIYVSLTGRNFALLEVTDSKSGTTESLHLLADQPLPGDIRIAEISSDWIDLVAPDGTPVRIDFSRQAEIKLPQPQ